MWLTGHDEIWSEADQERLKRTYIDMAYKPPFRYDVCAKWSARLVVALAVIATIVCIGMIAGYSMFPVIILYWATLTVKNVVDYIGIRRKKEGEKRGRNLEPDQ